ncbi:cytidylate kinase family protein [Candidatus Woesebacteria bacterium]|nr:cytidylate kinase family protein [Candidatus Woesebacteria bacterium]
MDLKYKSIAISGGIAVGKGTLLANLKTYLEPLGWHITSGGKLLRDFAKEYKNPIASLADDTFHHKLDDRTIELLKKGNCVIEAWLAGFMARDMPDVLRILLVCSEDAVRVDRVANRDKVSIEKAKEFIREREEVNMKEWKRIYGDYDFFNPDYFHLVIDTYSSGPNETVGKVLDRLGYRNGYHHPQKS